MASVGRNMHCYFNSLLLLLSHVWLFVTPWTAARQASLLFTVSRSLIKLMIIESVMQSNHLSSVAPFSSHPQSFPASGSFPHHSGFKQTLQSVSGTSAQHSLIHLVSATLTPHSSTLAATCPLCSYAPYSSSSLGFPSYFPMKWGQKYRA